MKPATENQIKYCHDLAMRREQETGQGTPCNEHGEPFFEESFEAADAFIKANKREQWPDHKQKEFEDMNHQYDWNVPNC